MIQGLQRKQVLYLKALKVHSLFISPGEQSPKTHPDYVTGFSDAESCFFIRFTSSKTRVGWAVNPVFCIELHIKDLVLIKAIQNYFGVGTLLINKKKNTVVFSVQSVKDIVKSVIPHFDKYPLITQKRADFLLWKMAVEVIANKEHLTLEGLRKIVAIRASINKGLTPKLNESFIHIVPVPRPKLRIKKKIRNPY